MRTYEKLDTVLVSMEWELKFPLANVQGLMREISDQTPLLLSSRDASHIRNSKLFKFELEWLTKDGFFDMVKDVWESKYRGITPMEKWQNKIRRVRCFLRGWARNIASVDKKKKHDLLTRLNALDRKAKTMLLGP